MKNGTRRLLLYTSLSALIFIILFKPSVTLAEKSEPFKTSIASLSPVERTTDKGEDIDSDPTSPEKPNPDPVIPPVEKPEDKPSVPDQEEKPNLPEPEKPNPPSKPEKDKGSDQNKEPSQNTKPKPKPKPETSSPTKNQRPRSNQNLNQNNSNNWTSPNRNNGTIYSPREPVNTQSTNDIQSINEEQTESPIEEVESEELNVTEKEPEVDLSQLSLKELIEMMKSGEITGEVREDKYFVISNETKEQREVTKEEALELGIIEEEEEELAEEVVEEEDTNEVIVEPVPEAIKSERTKIPLYVSAVGLGIIIVGSLMYFLQVRRNRN